MRPQEATGAYRRLQEYRSLQEHWRLQETTGAYREHRSTGDYRSLQGAQERQKGERQTGRPTADGPQTGRQTAADADRSRQTTDWQTDRSRQTAATLPLHPTEVYRSAGSLQ